MRNRFPLSPFAFTISSLAPQKSFKCIFPLSEMTLIILIYYLNVSVSDWLDKRWIGQRRRSDIWAEWRLWLWSWWHLAEWGRAERARDIQAACSANCQLCGEIHQPQVMRITGKVSTSYKYVSHIHGCGTTIILPTPTPISTPNTS